MKHALAVLILCSLCFAQTEIRRPGADADGGTNTKLGCVGTNAASTSMPNGYDAGGLSTSSSQGISGLASTTKYKTRIFKTWQSTNNTYSALTLNVNASSPGYIANGAGTGNACIYYSVNGGNSWTKMKCDSDVSGAGWSQATFTASLSSSQSLAQLRVGVCMEGDSGGGSIDNAGNDSLTMFDIWTVGTISTSQAAGSGNSAGLAFQQAVQVF